MRIFARNPSLEGAEKTNLSTSTASAATVFKVKNTDRFAATDKVLVGEMSRERSEILTVASLTATQLTLDAADFPHDADDPIYLLEFDKVRVYRSTTGENGVYSLLATVDVDVDNVDGRTWYEDANSLDTYWYKVSYYNSVDAIETAKSSAVQATGYAVKSVGMIITEVANEVGDPDFMDMNIPAYLSSMNNTSEALLLKAKRPYRFLKRKVLMDVDADDYSVPFPTDFWKVNYVSVNEVAPASSRVFRPNIVSPSEAAFQLSQQTNPGDYVDGIAFDQEENALLFYPAALTARIGAFIFRYYKKFTRFTDFSNIVETPDMLVYKFALKRDFYLKKANDDSKYLVQAKEYASEYNARVMELQREKSIEAGAPTGLGPDRKRYQQWGGRKYRQ